MSTIEVPSRVAFVNIKDGHVFFDCSPAEARMAAKLITEMRDDGASNLDFMVKFQTEVGAVVKSASSAPENAEWTIGAFSSFIIADGFRALEKREVRVSHIVMNALEYASIRKFDRDCIEAVTAMWKLRAGVMAYMWGSLIVVSKEMLPGSVVFCAADEDSPEFFRVSLKYDTGSDYGKPMTKEQPLDDVNEKLERLLACLAGKTDLAR